MNEENQSQFYALNTIFSGLTIKEIANLLHVDLEVAALDQVLRSLGLLRVLLDGSEYVSEAVWDDAATFRR